MSELKIPIKKTWKLRKGKTFTYGIITTKGRPIFTLVAQVGLENTAMGFICSWEGR